MLKCDIKEVEKEYLKFDDLENGDTFLVEGEGDAWYGMKVSLDSTTSYILDISDCIGELYSDIYAYNIVELVDLKIVRE